MRVLWWVGGGMRGAMVGRWRDEGCYVSHVMCFEGMLCKVTLSVHYLFFLFLFYCLPLGIVYIGERWVYNSLCVDGHRHCQGMQGYNKNLWQLNNLVI